MKRTVSSPFSAARACPGIDRPGSARAPETGRLRPPCIRLIAAGDALVASDCVGHAAATGHYAGRHAADYAAAHGPVAIDQGRWRRNARGCSSLWATGRCQLAGAERGDHAGDADYCGAGESDDLLRAQQALNMLTNAEPGAGGPFTNG